MKQLETKFDMDYFAGGWGLDEKDGGLENIDFERGGGGPKTSTDIEEGGLQFFENKFMVVEGGSKEIPTSVATNPSLNVNKKNTIAQSPIYF